MPPPGSFMNSPGKLSLATRNLEPRSTRSRHDDLGSPPAPDRIRLPHASPRHKPKDHLDMSLPASSSLSRNSSNGNHVKLHKRGGSTSSLPSPFTNGTASQFQTPFATYEEHTPSAASTPPLGSSVPKIKPYLKKISSAKEDQGMIDLSKSAAENDRLAGLGITDLAPKSVSDVSFAHTRRGQPHHGRTTSGASQGSNGSGSLRPGQTFTHPMAKTPRPYTPPTGSYANSINENGEDEGDDILEDEFKLGTSFRARRSMSISSAQQPTPLSQSHTPSDLAVVTKFSSTSQSNLSLTSGQSSNGRPRRNTEKSQDYIPSPSSRTSLDKAFSFAKRPDLEPQTRDEMIREARRKFEEKEASKDRKYERAAGKRRASEVKRQERQRRRSDASSKPALRQAGSDESKKSRQDSSATAMAGAEDEKAGCRFGGDGFQAMSYDEHRPAMMPRYGSSPGGSEKRLNEKSKEEYLPRSIPVDNKDGGWMRFSTWVQTRMLSCGGSRD